MTEGIKQLIYEKISAIMAEVEPIAKERFNEQQKYKFRGIDDVYQALQGIMAKHKVFTVPTILEDRTEEKTSRSGTLLIYRIIKIKYTFFAEDGSFVDAIVIGEGMDSGDKATNKAMSVAHKYALLQVFCIPTEDAKDPENDSHDLNAKQSDRTEAPPYGVKVKVSSGIKEADVTSKVTHAPAAPRQTNGNKKAYPVTEKQIKLIWGKSMAAKFNARAFVKAKWGLDSFKGLMSDQLDELIKAIDENKYSEEIPFAPTYQGSPTERGILELILANHGITDTREKDEIAAAMIGHPMVDLDANVKAYIESPL